MNKEVVLRAESEVKVSLANEVRLTKTLDGGIPLYKDAEVSIRSFEPNNLFPIAKYVLTSNLEFVEDMRNELLHADGVDVFLLDDIYEGSCPVNRELIS